MIFAGFLVFWTIYSLSWPLLRFAAEYPLVDACFTLLRRFPLDEHRRFSLCCRGFLW